MVCPSSANNRENLETIFQKSPNLSFQHQFRSWIKQIGLAILREVTRDPNELRISRYTDINGQPIWHAYDPVSHCQFSTRSEAELRIWIDSRFYSR